MIWFSVNAQLDGVDPGSENPVERTRYMVYQRRLLVEALKNKAMILAMIDNKEAASKTAEMYLEMAIPVSNLIKLQKEAATEKQMAEIEKMGPQQARAISTADLIRQENERLAKVKAAKEKAVGMMPKPVKKAGPPVLTGVALVKHLTEKQEEEMAARKAASTRRGNVPRKPN